MDGKGRANGGVIMIGVENVGNTLSKRRHPDVECWELSVKIEMGLRMTKRWGNYVWCVGA